MISANGRIENKTKKAEAKLGSPVLIKEKRIPRELQLSGDSLCDIMHIASFLSL